jgi:hypothetical protein
VHRFLSCQGINCTMYLYSYMSRNKCERCVIAISRVRGMGIGVLRAQEQTSQDRTTPCPSCLLFYDCLGYQLGLIPAIATSHGHECVTHATCVGN